MDLGGREGIRRFNPRSPCGERPYTLSMLGRIIQFQSTLPVRGATWRRWDRPSGRWCFNPCSPCGERLCIGGVCICVLPGFNPRSPCGERPPSTTRSIVSSGFNPRSPCGERLGDEYLYPLVELEFQSTLPVRGATRLRPSAMQPRWRFNPRSPCGERPPSTRPSRRPGCRFNPRSPCGERLCIVPSFSSTSLVSIHAPRAGSDLADMMRNHVRRRVSIHAPHAGSDSVTSVVLYTDAGFNPRSPCGERPMAALSDESVFGGFNPRSPCGERPLEGIYVPLFPMFQSTLPVRGAT